MMEALEDYRLYVEAVKRIASERNKTFSQEEVLEELGLQDSDLEDVEVEIE